MVLVNGEQIDTLNVADRGLAYGDGLFETIACSGPRPRRWPMHFSRLLAGCARLNIPAPSEKLLLHELESLLPVTGPTVAKLIITRGVGKRGYAPPVSAQPTRIISVDPWPNDAPGPCRDARLTVCNTRLARNPQLAGIKHLNRLEQVLASQELAATDYDEGIMLDDRSYVIECTRTNLFAVIDDVVHTPSVAACGIAGVMRSTILDILHELDLPHGETQLRIADLHRASEVFLCNTIVGIWPVESLVHDGQTDRYRARTIGQRLQARIAADETSS